jgi:hypothetical protein
MYGRGPLGPRPCTAHRQGSVKVLLGSLVAEVKGVDFRLADAHSDLGKFTTEGPVDFVVDASFGDKRREEWQNVDLSPGVVDRSGRRVTFRRSDCRAVVDLDARRVSMEIGGPWALAVELLLIPVLEVMTLELRRGAVFHGSSAVAGGLAAVFLGRSGAGKTTAAMLARGVGAEVISEELTYVALEPRGARVYALPFRQKHQLAIPGPGAYPVPSFYGLEQDGRDRIEPLPHGECVKQLLTCAVVAARDRAFTVPALEVCEAFAVRVPVRRLHFRKAPSFWQVVSDDLRAGGAR